MAENRLTERRCILGVFAHPDDETSCAGGTLTRYAAEGVEVFVATATRGEQGSLGSDGSSISRDELPHIREAELRAVLKTYGVHPPILLGYEDQSIESAQIPQLTDQIFQVMSEVVPNVVITFGPLGISKHADHIAVHQATVDAFHRYRVDIGTEPRLLYIAIPKEISDQFDMHLDGPEANPNVSIDITEQKSIKILALRSYKSQEDAQWLADFMDESPLGNNETFYMAYPTPPAGWVSSALWE